MRRATSGDPARGRLPFLRRGVEQDYDGRFDPEFERLVSDSAPGRGKAFVSRQPTPPAPASDLLRGGAALSDSRAADPPRVGSWSEADQLRVELEHERAKVGDLETRLRVAQRCLEQVTVDAARVHRELLERGEELRELRGRTPVHRPQHAAADRHVPAKRAGSTRGAAHATDLRTVVVSGPLVLYRLHP